MVWQCIGSRTDGIPPVDQSDIRGLGTGMTTDSSGSCLALELRVIPSLDAYIGASRILPPLPVLLPMHCGFVDSPGAPAAPGAGNARPMARMKPTSSLATAVQTLTLSLPLDSSRRYRAQRRTWAFQAISWTPSGARFAFCWRC